MSQRPRKEVDGEAQQLATAHIQNEAARDAFLALAHTALFAASISFVSDLAKSGHLKLLCVLIFAWLANVIGLLTLTFSYHAARRHISERLNRIWEGQAPTARVADALNVAALWTLPIAVICTFIFAVANVA